MLNKKAMQNFAAQFISGKIKLQKNPVIYGKNGSYYFAKDGLFMSFESDSVTLNIPDVGLFTNNTTELTQKTKNYINSINKIIKIENMVRGNDLARRLDGDIYTELSFKLTKKQINLDKITLKSYFSRKQEKTKFGLIFFDIPYFCNMSVNLNVELDDFNMPYVKISDNLIVKQKKVSGDFDMFKSSIANEVIDFKYFLDDVFKDQLNTLEMALL